MHYSYAPKPVATTPWGAPLQGLGQYEVPNPYVSTTHPYPTRYHGGIWTRPVFGYPRMVSVQSVFKCDDFNDGNPALRGLNGDYQVGNGVFGTANGGGGVFGPSLYGLAGQADDIDAIANYILNTGTVSTAAFDLQSQFRSWYNNLGPYDRNFSDDVMAKATSYRAQFNAANVSGGTAPLQPATTSSSGGGGGDAFSKASITNLQQLLNASLVKAGYNPLTPDGALGPSTCGAIQTYRQITGNPQSGNTYDSFCATKKPWNAPTKAGSGGGGGTPTYVPPPVAPTTPQPTMQAGMLGAGAWAMVAGGVLAIGVAVVGKKKGWF